MANQIVFKSKGFRFPFWPSIILMVNFGLLFMSFGFMIGIHPFAVTLLMLGSMILCIGIIGAYTTYTLHDDGISQELRSFNWSPLKLKPSVRNFSWNDIGSYQAGSDLSRSMEQYNYLYIKVKKFPYQLRLSDHQASKEDLKAFLQAFEQVLETGIVKHPATTFDSKQSVVTPAPNELSVLNASQTGRSGPLPSGIRRKPDFYDTRFARVLFWLFVLGFAFIASAMLTGGYMKATNLWRFSFIIIPGMSYFAWRLYGRQRSR
jgi:hypothetical protein